MVYNQIGQKLTGVFSVVFCLSVTWGVTFFLIVPIHNSLKEKYCLVKIQKLIKLNMIRSLAWSAKLVLLLYFL